MIKNLFFDKKISFWIFTTYLIICALTLAGVIGSNYNLTNDSLIHSAPSTTHWLGTDIFGRDVLSRALHGTVTAFGIGCFSALISVMIGTFLGLMAGYFGSWVDDLVQWLYTTIDSIPYILLLAAFSYALGQGLLNMYLALGLTSWVPLCRIVRGEVLKTRNLDFIHSAHAFGIHPLRIMMKHIFPHLLPILMIQFSLTFVTAIKVEVILSYLGLGVEVGTPSWGMMIDDAKVELVQGIWWNLCAATIFMFGLIWSVTMLMEDVHTTTQPKSKMH